MTEDRFEETKSSVLGHVEQLFKQIEAEMAMSHQEKFTLLEDAFEQATDESELRVAFDQWYADHSSEIDFEHEPDELWDHAINAEDDDDDDEDIEW